jgi:hypothetical protein
MHLGVKHGQAGVEDPNGGQDSDVADEAQGGHSDAEEEHVWTAGKDADSVTEEELLIFTATVRSYGAGEWDETYLDDGVDDGGEEEGDDEGLGWV